MAETGQALGPKRQALHLRLTELHEQAVAARKAVHDTYGQKKLEEAVRRTGLPGAEQFNGQIVSSWLRSAQRDRLPSVPQDGDVLLGVVAVWAAWAGEASLQADGRVDPRWLRHARPPWHRLLEDARDERTTARAARDRETAEQERQRTGETTAAVEIYRQRVRNRYRRLNLDVLGPAASAGEQAVIELRQVFMPQPSRPYTAQVPGEWRRLLTAGGLKDGHLPPGVATEDAARRQEAYHAQATRPVLEVLAGQEGRRLVVLGDPGAGKSTLTQYVALALAGGLHDLPAELARLDGLVPVVVELRTYAQEQWRKRSFEDFLEHTHDLDKMGLSRETLKSLLADSRVIMLFDGLDEVFDPGVRADVAQRITAFAAAHPDVRTVVTSREYGYRPGDFTPHGFAQVMLQDLERHQIETFVSRWYSAAYPDDPHHADQLTRRLLSAVRQIRAVAELAGNPLLLTVLASMGLGRTIPRERRKVYEHAVQVLIERWDKEAKFLTVPSPATTEAVTALEWLNVNQRMLLLENIARHMQEGAGQPAGTFIRHKELTALIVSFIIDGTSGGISRHAAEIAAERLVEQLQTRNFLLAHYGDGIYGFVHRTFLEYLAACDLLRRRAEEELSREEVIELLTAHADEAAWHEVILLTTGGLTKRDAASLIARLLDLHRTTELSWRAPMLALAIRALAEIDDFRPSSNTTDPRLSIATQSDAVVDALIISTRRSAYLTVQDALPALETFDRFWNGRQRYLRHYYSLLAFGRDHNSGQIAATLSLDYGETLWMEQISWNTNLHMAALEVLGERWPDREDTRQTILNATTNTHASIRRTALQILAAQWPDREDTRQTILNATTNTHASIRRTALQILAAQWPDHENTHQTILNATTNTHASIRRTALQILAAQWPDHENTHQTILNATTDPDGTVRWTALDVLGAQWPDHEDTRQTILNATTDPDPDARRTAVHVLGARRPDHEDTRQTILNATTDPDGTVRWTALDVLGARWPDHEDTRQTILNATTDPDPDARRTAVHVLGARWPDHEDTRQTILNATTDPDPEIRWTALRVLVTQWPDREDTHQAVLNATTNANLNARRTALQVLVTQWPDREDTHQAVLNATTNANLNARRTALQVLVTQWPDREDTHQTILNATTDTHASIRRATLETLGERWPEHKDTHQAVLNATTDTHTDVRATALQILTARFGDGALPILLRHAAPSQPTELRVGVAKALALLWPHEAATVPTLKGMARHPENEVRTTAEEALRLVDYWSKHLA